jgi:hypothetical protein
MQRICQHTNLMRMAYLVLINFVTFIIVYISFPSEIEINCDKIYGGVKPSIGLFICAAVVASYLCCLGASAAIYIRKIPLLHIRRAYTATTFLSLSAQTTIIVATFLYSIRDKVTICENPSSEAGIRAVIMYYIAGFLNVITLLVQAMSDSSDEL